MRHTIESIHTITVTNPDGDLAEIKLTHAWPQHIGVTIDLLMHSDRRFIQPDEGGVTFTFSNGKARYDFDHWNESGRYWEAHVNGSLWITKWEAG